jgi:hypothetical protein
MKENEKKNEIRGLPRPPKTPRERFLAIAPKRTQKVLDALRLLGRCGNRATYQYEREEIAKIIKAVDAELARMKSRFDDNEPTTFKL